MINKNYIGEIIDGEFSDAKAKIIAAGLQEFSTYSLRGARTRAIAAKAGVNHAAISYYFGGKKELYIEIANQVTDFIADYSKLFFERADAIEQSKSIPDAINLIIDFLMSRICCDDEPSEVMRNIIMIITREEIYQTNIFEIFFEKVFKPSNMLLSRLIEIASKEKIAGERAKITSMMLIGQVQMFNSARSTFKRINNWSAFGGSELEKVKETFMDSINKLVS